MDRNGPMGNGDGPNEDVFGRQLEKIRQIRVSECQAFQQIMDVYPTALHADAISMASERFVAAARIQVHQAVHNGDMPAGDAFSRFELAEIQKIVEAYLDLAEFLALRRIPILMDWEERLSQFLTRWEQGVIQNADNVSAESARMYVERIRDTVES